MTAHFLELRRGLFLRFCFDQIHHFLRAFERGDLRSIADAWRREIHLRIEIRYGQGWETVPFHFIYVSFTILYGFRAWRGRATLLGILFVTISTGVVTAYGIHRSWEEPPEMTEVPLMTLMFIAMVYHVRRRQQAQAVAEGVVKRRYRRGEVIVEKGSCTAKPGRGKYLRRAPRA